MSNESTPKQMEETNKQLQKEIELLKEIKKLKGETTELTEQEITNQRLMLAQNADMALKAGNLREAYEAQQIALKAINDTQAALNSLEETRDKLRIEANDLRAKGNVDEAIAIEKRIKDKNLEIDVRDQEIKRYTEIIKKVEEATGAYKNLSSAAKRNSEEAEGFFSSMTFGILKAGDAQKQAAYKFGDLTSRMLDSKTGALELALSFKQVVNVQNIAAAALDTVVAATKQMVTQFDIASAKFAATTGLAGGYNDVLIKVQKESNRFGISASEGGAAMADLLAGFNDFHRSSPKVQKDLTIGVASLGKLGVSAKQSTDMLNNMNKFMGMSGTEGLAASKKIGMMGTKIGITTSKMLSDYTASLKTLAVYGEKSIDVFTGIAAAAKAAGVETGTLLGLAEKFDTFSGAAETTGKLNAILGSQLSATEMLTASEDKRIKTLIGSVQATGQAFGSMDKFTQKAIANAAGITDMAEANKIFGMSMSEYENYEAQMKSSANAQAQFDEVMKKVTPTFEKLKLIAAEFAVSFGPALEVAGDVIQGILDGVTSLNDASGGLFGTIVGGAAGLALFASGLGGIGKMLNFVSFGLLKNIGLLAKKAAASLYNATLGKTEIAQKITKLGLQAQEKVADMIDIGQKTTKNTLTQAQASAELRLQMVQRSKLKTQMLVNQSNAASLGPMLAMGAAIALIGGGIWLAATGLAEFVKSFKGLSAGELIAAGIALTLFGFGLTTLVGMLAGLVAGPQAALVTGGVGVLLAIGGAIALIGLGVGLAAAGFGYMLESIAKPKTEQYLAFGTSMILFGVGLYAAAAGMAIFLPAFATFMGFLLTMAVNPLAWAAVGLLAAVAGSIFMIGLGAKLAIDSMTELISTIANSEGLGSIIDSLFGGGDVTVSAGVEKRVEIVNKLISDVSEADIKSDLENIALITTGVSAGLMTENTVSNLTTVASLADTIKNIFNPEITIEMDSGAVEKLFKEGIYKVNRRT